MHALPTMSVEVAGRVERRPGVLVILARDVSGRPTISCMRPQLLSGELLHERLGQIPAITTEVA